MNDKDQFCVSPGPWFSFVALLLIFTVLGLLLTPWTFLAIPFIYLGVAHSAQNFNLADGCLPFVVCILAVCATAFWPNVGLIIILGTCSGWITGCAERAIRARLVAVSTPIEKETHGKDD